MKKRNKTYRAHGITAALQLALTRHFKAMGLIKTRHTIVKVKVVVGCIAKTLGYAGVPHVDEWGPLVRKYVSENNIFVKGTPSTGERIVGNGNTIRTSAEMPKSTNKTRQLNDSGFYLSPEWRKLRYATIKNYGARCMACRTTEGVMHVDHIKPRHTHPHLELDPNNVQVLCEECNLGKAAWDDTDWRTRT